MISNLSRNFGSQTCHLLILHSARSLSKAGSTSQTIRKDRMKRKKKKEKYLIAVVGVTPDKDICIFIPKNPGRRKHYNHLNNTYLSITDIGTALKWTAFVLDY